MSATNSRTSTNDHVEPREAPPFDPEYVKEVSQERQSISHTFPLVTGTGYSIYKSTIVPAIKSAQQEIVVVTCFWAPSATRDELADALRELSKKAIASSRKISVHICFSSSSMARNMLLPTPKAGQAYPPARWKKLGLPGPEELTGLDLRVTRKFFWPFGIIHSKYVIVDRALAIIPSCNVSWERWAEVAIPIRGPVVEHLYSFHSDFWDRDNGRPRAPKGMNSAPSDRTAGSSYRTALTTLLPSPHTPALLPNYLHAQSLAGHCPCIPPVPPAFPPTPLLTTTHHLLSTARSNITMLTPNLTEPSVLEALREGLERGVDVRIYTNRSLMTVEQLVTAGNTTPRCVEALKKGSQEPGMRGTLDVVYFDDDVPQQVPEDRKETIPVKLHAKVTIVDDTRILLGSGNMDAASWKTSQELGILIEREEVVSEFKQKWSDEIFEL
ncbi:uncharacterized protein Z518_09464 [Rhinocladiella mackenziei CBS 650.93]|uniref:PLD phosphodiesterase domain-containing protein n=1 Tax=Rhinocladiella mackenziei CBS 650.93 TaxID=1442369 RepID=A0A0D2GTS5_9EURO|nr:uncharacterized protein Z518_09464 [Rhinocladiella mackenziei CBS 650.93]KIX01738.1 hypothetical protein Z518_09464 [Rhinocladiella mackenziei CBS 650.93]